VEAYVSVLDSKLNFMLLSLPSLTTLFNIQIEIPITSFAIENYYMSLDGHIIITTKNNEFIQGWLTFIDEESEQLEKEDENFQQSILDPKRNLIKQDSNVKLIQKNIFVKPTPKSEYSDLIKNCKNWLFQYITSYLTYLTLSTYNYLFSKAKTKSVWHF